MESDANRHVALDEVAPGITVSTVFLGLDHNWTDHGPPILFETMVFDDYDRPYQQRYSTWEEAEIGHRAKVAELRQRITRKDRVQRS